MISLALLFIFLAFYVFYNTSEKAIKYLYFGFEKWAKQHQQPAKFMCLTLLVVSCIILSYNYGIAAGIFIFFIILMTFGSLVITLTPIKLIRPKVIIILFIVSICSEIFIF